MNSNFKIENIGQIALAVSDIKVATAFYQDILELELLFEQAPQLVAKMPDHELWIGFICDPDNNLIGIMSEIR